MVTGFQTAQNDMGPTEGNFRLNPQVNIIELLSLIINNLLLIVGHVELHVEKPAVSVQWAFKLSFQTDWVCILV